jgi:hypothetical protein
LAKAQALLDEAADRPESLPLAGLGRGFELHVFECQETKLLRGVVDGS